MAYKLMYFITFALLSLSVSAAEEIPSECIDGNYTHEGKVCCLCLIGTKLVKHCSVKPTDGQCEICEEGTYMSYPTNQQACEPCTSCAHPSANMEVAESCTKGKDTKCRCKKDHFCPSGIETCKICHPCKKCGDKGTKVACSGSSDAVCHEIIEGNNTGTIVAVIVPISLIALAVGVFLFWRKRKSRKRKHQVSEKPTNGNATDVEMQTLREDVDLQQYLSDIAEVVGWRTMRDVARRAGIPDGRIESCQQNSPNDSQEQTIQLLQVWVERQGSQAHNTLIQALVNSHNNSKAKKVTDILNGKGR